jgi:hypothetical protein
MAAMLDTAQRRQVLADAAQRRRAAAARSAFEDMKERPYEEIGAAIEGGSVVGEGAYGPVYRCRLVGEESEVAVKVVGDTLLQAACGNPETEALIERMFMAEVRTLGHLRHRNVVRILGYSREVDGRRGFVYATRGRLAARPDPRRGGGCARHSDRGATCRGRPRHGAWTRPPARPRC